MLSTSIAGLNTTQSHFFFRRNSLWLCISSCKLKGTDEQGKNKQIFVLWNGKRRERKQWERENMSKKGKNWTKVWKKNERDNKGRARKQGIETEGKDRNQYEIVGHAKQKHCRIHSPKVKTKVVFFTVFSDVFCIVQILKRGFWCFTLENLVSKSFAL